MREFKFRIWHKKESRWLDPWTARFLASFIPENFTDDNERKRKSYDNLDYLVDDIIIQQYTGLKDKNGKDIYEGDVLKITDNLYEPITGFVIWNPECAGFVVATKVLHRFDDFDISTEFEIVGHTNESI